MLFPPPERVNTQKMQRLTRIAKRLVSGLAHGSVAYLGLNAILLVEEARFHLLYRLMVWDVSELRLFGFLLGQRLHP
jgi:hypothetical protein